MSGMTLLKIQASVQLAKGDETMSRRIAIGKADTFPEGVLKKVDADGRSIVVARTEDGFCALRNQCSHMPLPIAGGKLEGKTITCPWHNSQFDICTGENLDWVRGMAGIRMPGWTRKLLALGKKPQGITAYAVTEENGELYVDIED